MYQVLLIEDDHHKRMDIIQCLIGWRPDITISDVQSVQAAVMKLGAQEFSLIVLDMALPSHDPQLGTPPTSSMLSGGMEIIMELAYLGRKDHVIIVTQYPVIEVEREMFPIDLAMEKINIDFEVSLLGIVFYKLNETKWQSQFRNLLGEVK